MSSRLPALVDRLIPDGHAARVRWGVGAAIVIALLVIAIAVVVAALSPAVGSTIVAPRPATTDGPVLASDSPIVVIHVLGAVRTPGLYQLSPGSRVIDAVAAAGGFTADADRGTVNLARPLMDGEQIMVAVIGAVPAPPTAGTAPGIVNVNTATAAELENLPRVGPTMAQRIIDWRTANGRFRAAEDLLSVPGIGEKTLDGFRDLLTF